MKFASRLDLRVGQAIHRAEEVVAEELVPPVTGALGRGLGILGRPRSRDRGFARGPGAAPRWGGQAVVQAWGPPRELEYRAAPCLQGRPRAEFPRCDPTASSSRAGRSRYRWAEPAAPAAAARGLISWRGPTRACRRRGAGSDLLEVEVGSFGHRGRCAEQVFFARHFAARGGLESFGLDGWNVRWGFELDLFVLVFDLDVEQGVGLEATVEPRARSGSLGPVNRLAGEWGELVGVLVEGRLGAARISATAGGGTECDGARRRLLRQRRVRRAGFRPAR